MKALSGPLALLIVAAAVTVSLLREPLPAQEPKGIEREYKFLYLTGSEEVKTQKLNEAAVGGWECVDMELHPDLPSAFLFSRQKQR